MNVVSDKARLVSIQTMEVQDIEDIVLRGMLALSSTNTIDLLLKSLEIKMRTFEDPDSVEFHKTVYETLVPLKKLFTYL
jgi:hypothetical protein